MDPRLDQARLDQLTRRGIDAENAARRLSEGAPLAVALELATEELDRIRQCALELACQGHFDRAKEKIGVLLMLGDRSPATGLVFAECLRREGRAEEARSIVEMLEKLGGEQCLR